MQFKNILLAGGLVAVVSATAGAHVMLMPAQVSQGAAQDIGVHVGHPCKDAVATTALSVQIPPGFALESAAPMAGWHLENSGSLVTWRSDAPASWLGPKDHAVFMLHGRATSVPGVLYFKILQTCDKVSAAWTDVPKEGGGDKPEFPAARLEVLAAPEGR